jgi:hypothetical protein
VPADELVAALDPERAADRFADAYDRRGLSFRTDAFGMVHGQLGLDPGSAATVLPVLDLLAQPLPAGPGVDETGQQVLIRDDRNPPQRRLDALVQMAAITARHLGLTPDTEPDPASDQPASDEPGPVVGDVSGRARVEVLVITRLADLLTGTGSGVVASAGRSGGPGAVLESTALTRLACDSPPAAGAAVPRGDRPGPGPGAPAGHPRPTQSSHCS